MPTFRFDNKIPVPSGDPVRDIKDLRNTMYELVENLRYMFSNLGDENLGESLNKMISEQIGDTAKSVSVQVDEDGIALRVVKSNAFQQLSTKIDTTAAGLKQVIDANYLSKDGLGTVLSTDYNITTETANSFDRRIGTTEGDIDDLDLLVTGSFSQVYQDIVNIALVVKTGSGETSVRLSDGKLDISGMVTFNDLKTTGKTVIDGGNITTGTIAAERLDLSSRESRNGYIFETVLMDGMLLSVRHSGNLLSSSNPACALDPVEGLSLGTYGTAYGEIYTSGNVLKIKGTGGIHLNDKAFPAGFSLSEFNNNLKLSDFTNNAIAMATAYTTTEGLSGGSDFSMTNISKMDNVGIFSLNNGRLACAKDGYYLVSANAGLKSYGTTTPTVAIRKVNGSVNEIIAKVTDYVYGPNSAEEYGHSHQVGERLVYLEAGSYLSLYCQDPACKTHLNGCWISAIYLGI